LKIRTLRARAIVKVVFPHDGATKYKVTLLFSIPITTSAAAAAAAAASSLSFSSSSSFLFAFFFCVGVV
tara:strand:+ start:1289 stop:1495 length:207 start_codon:yes stop_codon:yes gene_type:complete